MRRCIKSVPYHAVMCNTNRNIAALRYSCCIVIQIHNKPYRCLQMCRLIELLTVLKMADQLSPVADHLSQSEFIKQYKCHPWSRSKVWNYFGFLTNDSGQAIYIPNEAICKLCNEHVKHSNSTTNLLTHLKGHHFIQHEEIISEIKKKESDSDMMSSA